MSSGKDKNEREKLLKKLEKSVSKVDESKLAQPPSLTMTALSGIVTFAAAALIAWFFAGTPTPDSAPQPLSLSPLWSGVAPHMTTPIVQVPTSVLPRSTASLFGKQVNRTSPTIFQGTAFDAWSDRPKWNLKSILEEAKNDKEKKFGALVRCRMQNAGQYYGSLDSAWEGTKTRRMTGAVTPKEMEVLFQTVREGRCAEGRYDATKTLEEAFPALPNFFAPGAIAEEVMVHVHTPGVMKPLEYSVQNTFLLQAEGSLEVVLVPAADLDRIYPFPFTSPFRGHSQVGHADGPINLSEFPNFTGATLHVAKLEAGEALWIPPFWSYATVSHPQQGSLHFQVTSMTPEQERILELVDLPVIEWVDLLADKAAEEEKVFGAGFALAKHFNKLRRNKELSFAQFLRSIIKERFVTTEMHKFAPHYDCPKINAISAKHPTFDYIASDLKRATKKLDMFPATAQDSAVKDAIELIAKVSSREWTGNTLNCWAAHAEA